MGVVSSLRPTKGGAQRQRRCRPTLEALEDRHLPAVGFGVVNLASDVPGLARTTDPNVVNPWGIAFSPTGPFWLADNGSGVSDIFDGGGGPFALVVTVPQGSTPTGVVFNGGPGFAVSENGIAAPSRFLFATEAGTIAGWTAVVDPTHALLTVDDSASGAVFTGITLAINAGRSFLYAADFSHQAIDVFDQQFRPVLDPGAFRDPAIPAGYAPFNIENMDGLLYVTYAERDADGHDDVPGVGHGYIDVYNTAGSLLRRFASQGPLDSPWGLALAPAGFGPLSGALLVGNNGDGHISAFDPHSGAFLGQLTDDAGAPIAIPYLWSLTFGNGHVGGDANALFFAAGVDDGAHGLFGAIQAPARRGTDTAGTGIFDPHAPGEPGDYPLPPRAGPALSSDSAVRPDPVVDFLPMARSSLVLVPTLSPAAPASTRFDALTSTAIPDAGPWSLRSVDDHVVALTSLLDVNASRTGPATRGEPRSEPSPRVIASDVRTKQSAAMPAPGPLEMVRLPPKLSSAAEPLAIDADPHEHVADHDRGIYTWLMGLLVLITSPAIWLYYLGMREAHLSEPDA